MCTHVLNNLKMKQVSVILSLVLLWSLIDCQPLQNADFIFPDDSQPNGIPSWALNHQDNLPSQRLPFPNNFPPSGRFPPHNRFPPPGRFPSQDIFPPQPPLKNFDSRPPQKFIQNSFIEPHFTTVRIADINTITTTPSPSFHNCMQNCPVTSEYNPICGSNRALYYNISKFRCAQRCGADAQIVRKGSCRGLFPMQIG